MAFKHLKVNDKPYFVDLGTGSPTEINGTDMGMTKWHN
jgi:hypothetical protein